MSVRVREQTALQHGVGRGLDSGRHVRRVERDLLDFGKVVFRVRVERHDTDLAQGVVLLTPNVCQIELKSR